MPEKVATLKKQNKQLQSQIAELSSELKNLKEMLEKRRTSDLIIESTTGLQTMRWRGDPYGDLNSVQGKAVREPKCLSDRLSKISRSNMARK